MARQISYATFTIFLILAVVLGAGSMVLLSWASPATFVFYKPAAITNTATTNTITNATTQSNDAAKNTNILQAAQYVKDVRFTNELNGATITATVVGSLVRDAGQRLILIAAATGDPVGDMAQFTVGITPNNVQTAFAHLESDVTAQIKSKTKAVEVIYDTTFIETLLGDTGGSDFSGSSHWWTKFTYEFSDWWGNFKYASKDAWNALRNWFKCLFTKGC